MSERTRIKSPVFLSPDARRQLLRDYGEQNLSRYWQVRCSCGIEELITGWDLASGRRWACVRCTEIYRKELN